MSAPTLQTVLSSTKLPTLPTVAVKLLELTSDPECDLGDIAKLVQYDQALAGKILKTVNSSYYSLAQPCPTIKRALAYLGLSTVKSLVLGFSLVDLTKKCGNGFDLMDYWRRCVYSAAAARRIALVTHCCDPDEAFIAALMQDVGMLAMHTVLGGKYDKVVTEADGNHHALPYCETAALGFTHAEAGARLGEQWCLPVQVVDPIRQHHQRGMPSGPNSALINAVILAYRISNLVSLEEHRKPVLDMVSAMSQTMFHMTPEDERSVLLMTTEDAKELSGLLDVHVGRLPDIESILATADDALIRQQPDVQPQVVAPPPQASPPPGEAFTDAMTGVGNRKHFDEELSRRFQVAVQRCEPLGLILVDADRLTAINETIGRVGGDRVLQAIAHRLLESLGQSGIVCRYGGEEFAVIIPGASRIETARTAERMRRHLEREHVDLRDSGSNLEAVQVTASFGVVTLEPATLGQVRNPMVLVQLADRALHAAKCDGRNCVRVFTPRPPHSSAA